MTTPLDAVLKSCSIEPVWFLWAELWAGVDEQRVRGAVSDAVALAYGAHYDRVCFESATGTQFCRSRAGAMEGEKADTESFPVRVLTFSVPRDPLVLAAAVEAIRASHSYEEPVIYITEGYATRADDSNHRGNPNRYWNRAATAAVQRENP